MRRHPEHAHHRLGRVAAACTAWLACAGLAGGQTPAAAPAAFPATEAECEGQCRLQFAEPSAPPTGTPLFSYRRTDADAASDAGDVANPLRPPVEQPAVALRYGLPEAPPVDAPRSDAQIQGADYAAPIADEAYALAAAEAAVELPVAAAPAIEPAAAPLAATAMPLPGTPVESPSGANNDRRLAPPSSAWADESVGSAPRRQTTLPSMLSRLKGLSSAGAGLAIVVGLLIACTFLLRRGGAKPGGTLPSEAFAVLGRAPLTSQSFAQLLRVGNKLVLVAVTADGAQPLAEVTDAAEVDRIAGLCVGGRSGGSSAEFQQVLAQLSREPARGFLGREGSAARRR